LGGTAYNYSATAIGKPFDGFLSAGGSLNYSILPVPGDYTINAIASVEGTDVRYFGGTNIVQPGDFAGVVIRATTTSSLSATFNINLAPAGVDDVRALLRMPNTSTIVAVATVDASPQVTTCMLYSMSQFDLTPDTDFDQDGRRYLHYGAASDSSRCDALAADGTGALFVGGMLNLPNTDLMAVARVTAAGQNDANYGAGGVALFNTRALFGPTYDERVFALGVQNGRAIAAGPSAPVASPTPANTDMAIVRLTDDERLFVGDFE
ncbi:MAG TPA: hypothetical protein VJ724_05640, partial [Tahibacter sp.]|nr:hypothetical protein [Tahibacter sp.]